MAPSSPLSVPQIAAISIGASTLSIGLIIGLIFFLVRRKRLPGHSEENASGQDERPQSRFGLAGVETPPRFKAELNSELQTELQSTPSFSSIRSITFDDYDGDYDISEAFPKSHMLRFCSPEAENAGAASLWDIEIEKSISQRPPAILPSNNPAPPSPPEPQIRSQPLPEAIPAVPSSSGGVSRVRLQAKTIKALMEPSSEIFPCAKCGKSFLKRYELTRHTRLQHTKPHKCTVQGCEYQQFGFGKPNDLARHMTNVHRGLTGPQNLHLCPVDGCEYHTTGFGRKDNWKRHVTQQHGISVD